MGKVFLVGAGPGDPDLLTIKALRLLQSANIVLHDSLVSAEVLALISPLAERIDVGKRRGFRLLSQNDINSLLVASAASHGIVVRLKGGDPLLFGRAPEEIQALREARIEFEIVNGISAAFAAAAAVKISLTDRRVASNVLFTTFSRSADGRTLAAFSLHPETTVVIYMPGPHYNEVSQWLLDAGLVPDLPCQVISKASQRDQSSLLSTVAGLATLAPLPAPALVLVGRVGSSLQDVSTAHDWHLETRTIPRDLALPLGFGF
jgi:uroporphyrin-III C-methyltransferase